jgi:uncharacterized protein YkwD
MRQVRILLFVLLFPGCFAAYSQTADSTFAYYQKLNNEENRLPEYKDSDLILRLKTDQLAQINKSRKKYHVGQVRLDILSSRVGNKMCEEAALNKYLGHWNMKGEKPYHRYAFAGGMDHVCENAASSSYTGTPIFAEKGEVYAEQMLKLHQSFMAEKAPDDGHKKNCIGKDHNYVGLGVYRTDKEFRYYEEFIERYYQFLDVPVTGEVNKELVLKLKPQEGKYFYFLVAFRDEIKPMSPSKIKSRKQYDDFGSQKGVSYTPWQLASWRKENGEYEIPLLFKKRGYYYINLYQTDKEYKKPVGYDTKGKIQGSGIVIEIK